MGLAPRIYRQSVLDVAYDSCGIAIENGRTFYDMPIENSEICETFGDAKLRELTGPLNFLGAATVMAKAVSAGTKLY